MCIKTVSIKLFATCPHEIYLESTSIKPYQAISSHIKPCRALCGNGGLTSGLQALDRHEKNWCSTGSEGVHYSWYFMIMTYNISWWHIKYILWLRKRITAKEKRRSSRLLARAQTHTHTNTLGCVLLDTADLLSTSGGPSKHSISFNIIQYHSILLKRNTIFIQYLYIISIFLSV